MAKRRAKKTSKRLAKKSGRAESTNLEAELDEIEKRYDSPIFIRGKLEIQRFSISHRRLNEMMGGGLPRGGPVELSGWEDSAKTSTLLTWIGDIQRQDPRPFLLLNYEHVLDPDWAEVLGVDTSPSRLIHAQPNYIEQGAEIAKRLLKKGFVSGIAIDSIGAAISKARFLANVEEMRDASGAGISPEARAWSEVHAELSSLIRRSQAAAIYTNHRSIKIGATAGKGRKWAEPPSSAKGGRALKYWAWVRVVVRASNLYDETNKELDGRSVTFKMIKNKTTPRQRGRATYAIVRGTGWDFDGEILDLALQRGIIVARGSHYFTRSGTKIGHGRAKLVERLADPTFKERLITAIEMTEGEPDVPQEDEASSED